MPHQEGYYSFMQTVTITETKNRFSAILDRVRHGETVLILDRRVPVARLEPAQPLADSPGAETLSQLERAGLLRRGPGTLPPGFLERRLPQAARGASAVAALLREREEGR
jgi:prevent-host-death family protein